MRIQERKQVGTIYHFTSWEKIKSILSSNKLLGFSFAMPQLGKTFQPPKSIHSDEFSETLYAYGVSATRDRNFYKTGRNLSAQDLGIRIKLNGTKISSNYKILAVAEQGFRNRSNSGRYSDDDAIEAEERIVLSKFFKKGESVRGKKNLENLDKYIDSVDVLLDVIDEEIKESEMDVKKDFRNGKLIKIKGVPTNVQDNINFIYNNIDSDMWNFYLHGKQLSKDKAREWMDEFWMKYEN
jgi:hypothetical protein